MTHQTRPVRRADLARRKGVTRAAITLATRPGGPLEAAVLPGGNIDAAHVATARWLGRFAYRESEWIGGSSSKTSAETFVTLGEFARRAGVSVAKLRRDIKAGLLAGAVESPIDLDHPAAEAFIAKHHP